MFTMFLQPEPAATEAPRVTIGVAEKIGGTIGITISGLLLLGAIGAFLMAVVKALQERFSGPPQEIMVAPGEAGMLKAEMRREGATEGSRATSVSVRTFLDAVIGLVLYLIVLVVLLAPAGILMGSANDAVDAAKKAAGPEAGAPAGAIVFYVISGLLTAAAMLLPILVPVLALKGMHKSATDQLAVQVPIDPGTKQQLWAEWLRDKVWVSRRQSKQRTAQLIPAIIAYAVSVVGTLLVYAFLCIFIPDARHVGWPFQSGGPYWMLLFVPPMVCLPPFLPLFASLFVSVPMRRKVREQGGVTG